MKILEDRNVQFYKKNEIITVMKWNLYSKANIYLIIIAYQL